MRSRQGAVASHACISREKTAGLSGGWLSESALLSASGFALREFPCGSHVCLLPVLLSLVQISNIIPPNHGINFLQLVLGIAVSERFDQYSMPGPLSYPQPRGDFNRNIWAI